MKKLVFVILFIISLITFLLMPNVAYALDCDYYSSGLEGTSYAYVSLTEKNGTCLFKLRNGKSSLSFKSAELKGKVITEQDNLNSICSSVKANSCPKYAAIIGDIKLDKKNFLEFWQKYDYYYIDNAYIYFDDNKSNLESLSGQKVIINSGDVENTNWCQEHEYILNAIKSNINIWKSQIANYEETDCKTKPISNINIYNECLSILNFKSFETSIIDLSSYKNCISQTEYDDYVADINFYQAQYDKYIDDLKARLNERTPLDQRENCSDYTYNECTLNLSDSEGNKCTPDHETKTCVTNRKCSYYTTEETCPKTKNYYGRCRWNEKDGKCEKYDINLCEDYNTKQLCPTKDEEGNACKWDEHAGCINANSNSGTGSNNDVPTPNIIIEGNSSGNNYQVTAESICSDISYRKPMKFVGKIINLIRYFVPILIIGLGAFDLYKSIATNDPKKNASSAIKSLIIRIIAGVFIFLLPGIILFILGWVSTWNSGSDSYNPSKSWACCTECLFNASCEEKVANGSSYCK